MCAKACFQNSVDKVCDPTYALCMSLRENRIRRLRKAQGLTTTDLGSLCGVHENTVRRWESGTTGVPDKHKMRLSQIFGVSIVYLMGWPEGDGNNGQRMAA